MYYVIAVKEFDDGYTVSDIIRDDVKFLDDPKKVADEAIKKVLAEVNDDIDEFTNLVKVRIRFCEVDSVCTVSYDTGAAIAVIGSSYGEHLF